MADAARSGPDTDHESERDRFQKRAHEQAAKAARRRERIDPSPPDRELAVELAREGVGPTVALYCEARTGGTMVDFDQAAFDAMEAALNDWLACYASCFGSEYDRDATIRAAAELLVDTHDAVDVAAVLTGVPDRG